MIYEKVYDATLEGHSYNNDTAVEWANGFVFGECETSEQNIAHSYCVTVTDEGIGVYYCYGADHYFFTDETGDE